MSDTPCPARASTSRSGKASEAKLLAAVDTVCAFTCCSTLMPGQTSQPCTLDLNAGGGHSGVAEAAAGNAPGGKSCTKSRAPPARTQHGASIRLWPQHPECSWQRLLSTLGCSGSSGKGTCPPVGAPDSYLLQRDAMNQQSSACPPVPCPCRDAVHRLLLPACSSTTMH
jgi:hypothetical protein